MLGGVRGKIVLRDTLHFAITKICSYWLYDRLSVLFLLAVLVLWQTWSKNLFQNSQQNPRSWDELWVFTR